MSIHQWARVGGRPEHRDWIWDQDKPSFPPEVDESAFVQPFVTIDAGCYEPTRVGARTIMLTKSHAGHDAQIGEACEIAPSVVIGGHVVVGDRVKVGMGAVILPGRRVGDDAVIGAGAVVTRDVPAGETWCGNPASVDYGRVRRGIGWDDELADQIRAL